MALNRAYLSLGSNIEPEQNLPAAVALLAQHGRIYRVSSVWQSLPDSAAVPPHPSGGARPPDAPPRRPQPDFLNAAVLLLTSAGAAELRAGTLRQVEASLGRIRSLDKFAPRPIDIDIMLFNEEILDLDGRHVPDPEIYARPFVAIPLAELDLDYVHPETGETLRAIAARFDAVAAGMRRRADVVLQVS